MAIHDNVFKLLSLVNEQGLHPSDIMVELREATLASGTVEVPTVFKNGNVLGVFAMRNDNATVHATTGAHSYTSDKVVTSGAITVSSTVNTHDEAIFVVIFGRREI